jgi:nitrite reductase (NADH) small subunit
MTTEHNLGPVSQVPEGEGRVFDIGVLRIAVFHGRDGRVYATQPDCPHLGGPLADGLIGSGRLVCPLHDRTFDLATGEGPTTDCSLQVYPARLEGDQILVMIEG